MTLQAYHTYAVGYGKDALRVKTSLIAAGNRLQYRGYRAAPRGPAPLWNVVNGQSHVGIDCGFVPAKAAVYKQNCRHLCKADRLSLKKQQSVLEVY